MKALPAVSPLESKALTTLSRLLETPVKKTEKRSTMAPKNDVVFRAPGRTFVVDFLTAQSAAAGGPVGRHAASVRRSAERYGEHALPLLVVPFMSESGRRACSEAGVQWIDLSGNARIVAPGLRIMIDGQPNQFRTPGRPPSVFAPKSARVARQLLMHPNREFTQQEIARATEMTPGFVSRIVARLEAQGYVERSQAKRARKSPDASGTETRRGRPAIRLRDPTQLLDDWREQYRFDGHRILRGQVSARSGESLVRLVDDALAGASIPHAATGLAAAWQMTHFAGFRIATFFVDQDPSEHLRRTVGFHEVAEGGNLWLVNPNDSGVFHGAELRDGVRCVHPVQAYLDLKAHPERAAEAAESIRTLLLKGDVDDG